MKGFVRAVAVAEAAVGDGLALVDDARRDGLQVILLSDRSFAELRPRGMLPHFDGVVAESGAAVRVGAGPVRRRRIQPWCSREGLLEVLHDLEVDPHDTLGISADGDLLHALEVAVPADLDPPAHPRGPAGPGLTFQLVLDEVRHGIETSPQRHDVRLTLRSADGRCEEVTVPGAHANLVLCAAGDHAELPQRLVSRWSAAGYGVVVLEGTAHYPVGVRADVTGSGWLDRLQEALRRSGPSRGAIGVDLSGETSRRRATTALAAALAAVRESRRRTGRPHWVVIDPAGPVLVDPDLPPEALDLTDTGHCLVLRDHEHVAGALLRQADVVVPCSPGCPLPARRGRHRTG